MVQGRGYAFVDRQRYVVRCASELGGKSVVEERPVQGAPAARRAAEMLATTLNVTATVYGKDKEGEFVYGVYELTEDAGNATSPVIKRLYAESAAATLAFKDQLLADIPEETVKGFASMAAALGYIVAQHKNTKRKTDHPRITYSSLFRVFCGQESHGTYSLPVNDATIALLGEKLSSTPGWMWISDLRGTGSPATNVIYLRDTPRRVSLKIDDQLQVIRPRTIFRGTVPDSDAQFLLIAESGSISTGVLDSIGLVYRDQDEAAAINLVRRLIQEANPFKDKVVLINRDLRTVRSRMSNRSWSDVIPHEQAKAELDFIVASIRNRDMLKAEGLTIKRGLLLSGPPGDGKSSAIECFVNEIAGEATVIVVEAVDHLRAIYHLAQLLAPAAVILEDLDLMTKNRQNLYASLGKDDVTGELLQVLSGGSAYPDVITIATTNHPEAIDDALKKRAGRFDAHVRMGYPSPAERQRILDLYLDRFSVADELTRWRVQQALDRDLGKLNLVPAHIEEFVKAGVKRARLARRIAEFSDFEPGIESTKSIATAKAAV